MKSLNESFTPKIIFWTRVVEFLNGKIFINVIIPSFKPWVGNHIPDKTDWPTITIDDIPPIDFSLHKEPNNIPMPIKNSDVTMLNNIANIKPKPNIEESKIPPIKKNNIDCVIVSGKTDNAYANINSYDFALETYNLVKKEVFLSNDIKSPVNNVKKAWEKTTIPGAKYFISNCSVKLWNIK